jgi:hypothetical protein
MATGLSKFGGGIKCIGTMAGHPATQGRLIRIPGFNGKAITFQGSTPGGIGFREKPARVQGEQGYIGPGCMDLVGDHLVLHAERCRAYYGTGIPTAELPEVIPYASFSEPFLYVWTYLHGLKVHKYSRLFKKREFSSNDDRNMTIQA